MRVLVVGAAGRTGRAVVERAVAAGHDVTAFVHSGGFSTPRATVRVGDARDVEALAAATAGQDAVIDTVGGRTPYRHTTLETDVATTVVAAMRRHGVGRLVLTSSLGVRDSLAHTPFLTRVVVATFLRGSTADKAGMEAVVEESGLDWVVSRPAVLTDKPRTGSIRVLSPGSRGKAGAITRADLADFLVDQLTDDTHLRSCVTLTNPGRRP